MAFTTMLENAAGLTREEIVNRKADETVGWVRSLVENAGDRLAAGDAVGAGIELGRAAACLDVVGLMLDDSTAVWSDGQAAYVVSPTGCDGPPTLAGALAERALIYVRMARGVRRDSPQLGVKMLDVADSSVGDLQAVVGGMSGYRRM